MDLPQRVPIAVVELTIQLSRALGTRVPGSSPFVLFGIAEGIGFWLMVRGCRPRTVLVLALGYVPLMTSVLFAYPFVSRNIWAALAGGAP